ncbi:MAG: YbhB/YbcL family Raf kinase inhibitor-like protein [Legionella sp.]|nr:MAG: YbhB/YbcL family Raf kinase inhibitor-like protein [Legionella sp.]
MKMLAALFCFTLGITNCSFAAEFALSSPAFNMNSMIPVEYTCHGKDLSPPLMWHNIPANTQSLALVMDDPDAPGKIWQHWILFNIPISLTQLEAGTPVPVGAGQAQNSWGKAQYNGPCPPLGIHRYVFKLYALDKVLNLSDGVDADTALNAMTGHVIGTAEWIGLYQTL